MEEEYDPKDFLIFALNHFNIKLDRQDDCLFYLESNYTIEIEGISLFKLLHEGSVVAPFSDVEELCNFIIKDMQINEKS